MFNYNLTRRTALHVVISRSVLLRMGNVSHKFVHKIKTHISCSIIFFFEDHAVCEIMWKNAVEPERPQVTI